MQTKTALNVKTNKELQNVPKLRFPEFEVVWMRKKFGEQVNGISSGKTKPGGEGHYHVFGSTGIIGKCRTFTHEGEFLLVARVGANAGTINKVAGKFGVTDNTLVVDSKATINLDFAKFALTKYNLNRLIFGSGQPLITGGLLKALKIFIPSLPEQQKIAAFLSAVDKKIQQLTRKKELLELYKKGVMQKIFSLEIRFKRDDGSDYREWEEKRLGEVAIINPKSNKLPETFFYIDLESVEKGRLLTKEKIQLKNAPSRAQRLLKRKDILFQTVRPYQKNNHLFDRDGIFVASTGYAQMRTRGNPYFLYQLLHFQPLVNVIIRWSTGSNYPAINPSDLRKIKIMVPSLKEEETIGLFLKKIDEKIDFTNFQITETRQFKKGLLQQMFV